MDFFNVELIIGTSYYYASVIKKECGSFSGICFQRNTHSISILKGKLNNESIHIDLFDENDKRFINCFANKCHGPIHWKPIEIDESLNTVPEYYEGKGTLNTQLSVIEEDIVRVALVNVKNVIDNIDAASFKTKTKVQKMQLQHSFN